MSAQSRTVVNPVNGEKVTFLKTTEETSGNYLLAELELTAKGKIPLHYHPGMTERLKVLDGRINIRTGKEQREYVAGEEVIIPPRTRHCFWNSSGEAAKMEVEFRPAGDFEKAVRAGDGLAEDGKANKQGLPKNIFHMAIIFEWMGSYFPGIPEPVQGGVFGGLAKLGKWLGKGKELEKYL
jgi:quercetin dioxygenase-like cupin family protein